MEQRADGSYTIGHYLDGDLHGSYKKFNCQGLIIEDCHFLKSQLHGLRYRWNEDRTIDVQEYACGMPQALFDD